ncbi:Reticulon-like protein B11 [Acorus calamus]|uniref:Reticulon-like protein n=1 Tax=Acorus calamus TaxID=4465 RepID=A0AAV9CS66_ACOCL|nr:Reticulon-like protein B11 [Acorus calamus]
MGEDTHSTASSSPPSVNRISVYQALGGGPVAEILLWKRRSIAAFLLASSTTLWIIFEFAGYNPLSFVANVFLLLVVILFFWAKSASLLNRPLPPLPDLEVSDEFISNAAEAACVWVNHVLAVARDCTIGRDVILLLKVNLVLWVVSYIGSLFSFLTLVYIGVVVSFTIPVMYDKYQDLVDEKLNVAHKVIQKQYRKIDDCILSKISGPVNKDKKTQ